MKKNLVKIIIIVIALIIIFALFSINKKNKNIDTIQYKGKTYVLLEYNMDIFTYNHNSNSYYEEDKIHPVPHNRWNIVYFNGDLFVLDSEVEEAKAYYADDNNYDWFFVIDDEDSEVNFPISVSKNELKYLYNMEDMNREETMLFDDIKEFGTLKKTSKDKFISAIICLAYYQDSWYWRTEIIDVNQENDPEYVIKIPNSLNDKIIKLFDK